MTDELEECRSWVERNFSDIPGDLVVRAFSQSPEDLELLAGGKCVECGAFYGEEHEGDCSFKNEPKEAIYSAEEFPAMWGWLFHPRYSSDEDWIRENAEEIAKECGFLIYESDETGILLGIDGAGYDFYEKHWLPLYQLWKSR